MSVTRPHESPECRCEPCRMHDDPITTATAKIAVAMLVGGNVEAVAEQARAMLVATLDRMPAIDPSHYRNGFMSEREVVARCSVNQPKTSVSET